MCAVFIYHDSLKALWNSTSAQRIDEIQYDVDGVTVTIKKSEYQDYFRVWDDDAKVYKTTD